MQAIATSTTGNPSDGRISEAVAGRFVRHRGPVTCVVGIPGKNAAVSAAYDSAVAYVDLEARTLELMGYHDHLVNAVTVNPQGTKVASSSSDYSICIWDLASRRPERVLRGHGDDVNGFAWISDRRGASVSHDNRVYVWNLETGAVVKILEGHEKYAMSVDCADGKIYSAGDDMTLRQWDAETGELLRTWGPFEVETDTCAIDSRNGRVILGADDGCLRIFDIASGELVREVEAHRSGIKKVAVSPVTGDVVSAAYDQRLLVWDARTFALLTELTPDRGTWERSINWTPDGRRILAGTFDGTVLVWDAASGSKLAEIGRGDGASGDASPGNLCFNEVSADEHGETALVSDDGFVRLARLTARQAEVIARVEPASGRVLMNAVTLDGDRVLAGAHDQKVHIFHRRDAALGGEIEVDLGEGPINCIRVSHHPGSDGDAFAGCYSGALVRLGATGEIKARWRFHDGAVKALVVHPTEALGVSCSADGGAFSWTLDGELVARYPGHVAIADDVDLDPGGERMVTVSRDFSLVVYDLRSGRILHSLSLGKRSPKSVCFWDRDTVIVGNYWGYLLRYDLATESVTRRRIAENGISSLSRSGAYVAASSYDGGVYLLRPDDLEVVNVLRAMVQKIAPPISLLS